MKMTERKEPDPTIQGPGLITLDSPERQLHLLMEEGQGASSKDLLEAFQTALPAPKGMYGDQVRDRQQMLESMFELLPKSAAANAFGDRIVYSSLGGEPWSLRFSTNILRLPRRGTAAYLPPIPAHSGKMIPWPWPPQGDPHEWAFGGSGITRLEKGKASGMYSYIPSPGDQLFTTQQLSWVMLRAPTGLISLEELQQRSQDGQLDAHLQRCGEEEGQFLTSAARRLERAKGYRQPSPPEAGLMVMPSEPPGHIGLTSGPVAFVSLAHWLPGHRMRPCGDPEADKDHGVISVIGCDDRSLLLSSPQSLSLWKALCGSRGLELLGELAPMKPGQKEDIDGIGEITMHWL